MFRKLNENRPAVNFKISKGQETVKMNQTLKLEAQICSQKLAQKGDKSFFIWEQPTETMPRVGVGGGVNPSLGLRGLEALDLHALRHKASADFGSAQL